MVERQTLLTPPVDVTGNEKLKVEPCETFEALIPNSSQYRHDKRQKAGHKIFIWRSEFLPRNFRLYRPRFAQNMERTIGRIGHRRIPEHCPRS